MSQLGLAGERCIVFRVGTALYLAPLLSIKEIVDPLPYTRVPNGRPHFLGLANLRGQLVGVIDLGLYLQGRPSQQVDKGVLLICEDEGRALGALVSRVEYAVTLEEGQLAADPSPHSLPPAAVLGVARIGERIMPLISLAQLLAADQDAPAPFDRVAS